MPSSIAWLDQSAEEQRRVRELVRLFADSESRDELGIGQVRDVYSNRLFPGTSVIQTRARYFLFIPWLFQLHQAKGRTGADLFQRVQEDERRLISTLADAGHIRGLIGAEAGPLVKRLPTAVYWAGLQRFGVLREPIAPDAIAAGTDLHELDPGAEEGRSARVRSVWHPELAGLRPKEFPATVEGGFDLTSDEAAWLRDLTLQESPDTLLAHLVSAATAPDDDSAAPWDDSVAGTADEPALRVLEEARLFSLVVHGAALLYNVLLAEAYEDAGCTGVDAPTDRYREALVDWSEDISQNKRALMQWDFEPWWAEVRQHNPRIGPLTRSFLQGWLSHARDQRTPGLADDSAARNLVRNRERVTKKSQARLENDRLLRAWNGASGTNRLVYRWGTVRDLATDIVRPLGVADAPT